MTSGPLIFTVSVENEPVLLDGSVIELRLDTDMDASTGSANGVERLVHRLWTGSTRLCSWTGAGFSCASSPLVSSTYVDGFLAVTTTATALGIAGPVRLLGRRVQLSRRRLRPRLGDLAVLTRAARACRLSGTGEMQDEGPHGRSSLLTLVVHARPASA